MPSDQDESRTVMQHTSVPDWPAPDAQAPSIVDVPPREDDQPASEALFAASLADEQLVDEAINTDDLVAPDTESDLLQWASPPPLVSKETLGTFWRQFAPILVPLPFGLLVFFATLPATLQGLPAHPSVLIMTFVLLALIILQGTFLYFAGSNDTLLTLYIAGGYTLFIVAGIFAAFGGIPALITFGVLFIAGLLLARRGLQQTRVGHVDIVTSFGKYAHTLEPGLNLLLPWERVAYSLNTQETTWTTPKMEVPTSRDQKVVLSAAISYQLLPEDAYLAATSVKNWEGSLQDLFRGTVQSLINALTVEDFVTWTQSIYTRSVSSDGNSFNPAAATRWDRINNTLARRMQDHVATWGVQINWVRIQDLTPLPVASTNATILHLNGEPGGSTQIMKSDVQKASAAAPPPESAKTERLPAPVQSAAPAPETPHSPPKTGAAKKPPRVEILVDTYDAVRQGTITDPQMILQLADHFETLASDHVANTTITFDAARAASTLRQRAQKYQKNS